MTKATWKKKFFWLTHSDHSPALRELGKEFKQEQRQEQQSSLLVAHNGLLNLLCYTMQDQLPRSGSINSGLVPLTSIIKEI